MKLPSKIRIREVGPREGLQTLAKNIALEDKLKLIDILSESGLSEIEVTSFVRPDLIPQMADAELLMKNLQRKAGVKYTALYLNRSGFERAERAGCIDNRGWINTACSETFLKRNANSSTAEIIASLPDWLQAFRAANKSLEAVMVSTAFGCSYEGKISSAKVVSTLEQLYEAVQKLAADFKEICLADTMGWGTPLIVQEVIQEVKKAFPEKYLSLHLHDTRGSGLANAYAALECGIDCFDSSIGGMGGCPFAKGAAGNIATEDLLYMCNGLGIETGLNLEKLVEAALFAEKIVGTPLAGKIYKIPK